MEGIIGSLALLGFMLLLFTDDHWGPGVRNILNGVAHRIRYGKENVQVSNAAHEGGNRRKWGWLRWALTVIVGVPAAIYFALQIYEDLS